MHPMRNHPAAGPVPAVRGELIAGEDARVASAGPVGALHAEIEARLTAAEYERWLLPPEPREGMEKVIHWLSLGAGVIALSGGMGLLWMIL